MTPEVPIARVVDHQAHWYPPALLEALSKRSSHPRATAVGDGFVFEPFLGMAMQLRGGAVDLGAHMRDLDDHAIDAILVSAAPVSDFAYLDPGEAAELSALVNREYASAQRSHPSRFIGLATVPAQDPKRAIEVLDEAILELGLAGVCLCSNIDGRTVAGPEMLAFYERVAELDVPLVLHPALKSALCPPDDWGGAVDAAVGWMADTATAALSLVIDGTLDRVPSLRILHPHLGGVLPFVAGRLAAIPHMPHVVSHADRPLLDYLRENFVVDTANLQPGAMTMAANLYGPDRIVFASDYPWLGREPALQALRRDLDDRGVREVLGRRFIDATRATPVR